MEWKIETQDLAFSYESAIPVSAEFDPEIDVRTADTQGNLRKVQKGTMRHRAKVVALVSQADFYATFIPMLEYSQAVKLYFDRTIPGRVADNGFFTFEKLQIEKTFADATFEISMNFVEILGA